MISDGKAVHLVTFPMTVRYANHCGLSLDLRAAEEILLLPHGAPLCMLTCNSRFNSLSKYVSMRAHVADDFTYGEKRSTMATVIHWRDGVFDIEKEIPGAGTLLQNLANDFLLIPTNNVLWQYVADNDVAAALSPSVVSER